MLPTFMNKFASFNVTAGQHHHHTGNYAMQWNFHFRTTHRRGHPVWRRNPNGIELCIEGDPVVWAEEWNWESILNRGFAIAFAYLENATFNFPHAIKWDLMRFNLLKQRKKNIFKNKRFDARNSLEWVTQEMEMKENKNQINKLSLHSLGIGTNTNTSRHFIFTWLLENSSPDRLTQPPAGNGFRVSMRRRLLWIN